MHKEAKKLSAPTGKLSTEYLSIKELQAKKKEGVKSNAEDLSNKPVKPFSYDDLKMAWRKFGYKAKDENLDTLFTAITSKDPVIKENYVIAHQVDNEVQKTFIDSNETKLLSFLRKELENWEITIECTVGAEDATGKKLYSGQDKFKDMAERNPQLKVLQQRFKLDIDF